MILKDRYKNMLLVIWNNKFSRDRNTVIQLFNNDNKNITYYTDATFPILS